MFKKLVSHSAIYGLAPQIPKLVSVFTLPITTKFLTPLDFGVYGVITALVAAIGIFSNLGLNITLSNTFFKSPTYYKYAWRQIYGFLFLWNFIYAGILALVIWLNIPDDASENTLGIVLANIIPIVLFGPTQVIGSLYYQLNQRPLQIATRSTLFGIIGVLLTLLFVVHFKMGYMGWFISTGITQVLMQASYWYPVNVNLGLKPIFNFKRRLIKAQLKVSLPTVPHYYGAYLLNSSDRLLMKYLQIPIHQIGLYNVSNTVSNLINMAGTASGQAVAPMLLKTYKDKDEISCRKLVFTLQIVFLIGCFLMSIWLKEIFELLIKNKELAAMYPLGVILVMAYSYRPMYLGANNRLFYYEKTKKLPMITFVAGISTVLINLIFIPIWGFEVAAYSTFIGLMYMGYSGYFMRSFKETNTVKFYPVLWLLGTIILTATAYLIVDLGFLLKGIITFMTVLIGARSLFKLTKSG